MCITEENWAHGIRERNRRWVRRSTFLHGPPCSDAIHETVVDIRFCLWSLLYVIAGRSLGSLVVLTQRRLWLFSSRLRTQTQRLCPSTRGATSSSLLPTRRLPESSACVLPPLVAYGTRIPPTILPLLGRSIKRQPQYLSRDLRSIAANQARSCPM